jgi:hypothetical protein
MIAMAMARPPDAATPARSGCAATGRRWTYARGTEEFVRVLTISAGLRDLDDAARHQYRSSALREAGSEHELLQALLDLWPDIVGFGIGFAVIGRYCAAHHRFVALVQDGQAGNKAPSRQKRAPGAARSRACLQAKGRETVLGRCDCRMAERV